MVAVRKRLGLDCLTMPQVRNALSRTRKEETVELLVEKMQTSSVVFGMRFKGLDVRIPAPPCVFHHRTVLCR